MDPNAAPWRALESAIPAPPAGQPAPETERSFPFAAIAGVLGAGALAVVAFLLAFGSGGGELQLTGGQAVAIGASGGPAVSAPPGGRLVVEVVGAVAKPGVYRLADGARIGDLIELAGGYGPRVDTDRAARDLNLAALLRDGDQVRVPSRDDPGPSAASADAPAGAGGAPAGSGGLIDLNAATPGELESLPGIGPVTAGEIVASREEAPFASVDDLRGRKLVGEKTFEKLRDLVTVR